MTITAQPRAILAAIDRSACPGTRHGDRSAYINFDCACTDALEDHRRYCKMYRTGNLHLYGNTLVDAEPSRRKVRALLAIGHAAKEISDCSGVTVRNIRKVCHVSKRVGKRTADAITAAYILLADQNGTHEDVRTRAQNAGFHPPEYWIDIDDLDEVPMPLLRPEEVVDEVLVKEALLGSRKAIAELHDGAEKLAFIVEYLSRDGHTLTDLETVLGCDRKQAIPDMAAFVEGYLLHEGNTVSSLMRTLECSGTMARQHAQRMVLSWLGQVARERIAEELDWDDVAAYMVAVAGRCIMWGDHANTGKAHDQPATRSRLVLADAA